jgi:hypothetical protein
MEAVDLLQATVGGLLLFVVPGFALARCLFPEWRFRGPDGARRALETATLAFVLSVALTVLVGSALLGLAPGGFAAAWGDPVLEVALAAVAVVAFAAGAVRGAYSRIPPTGPVGTDDPGGEGSFELTRALDRLHREDPTVGSRRVEELEQRREEEYAR